MVLATSYPRIRVSTSNYTYIISRGGEVPATWYPRILSALLREATLMWQGILQLLLSPNSKQDDLKQSEV